MKTLTQTITDAVWNQISVEKSANSKNHFKTPDSKKGTPFTVFAKTVDHLSIIPKSGKTSVTISKESLRRALEYLIRHNHASTVHSCEIGASKSNPGPLDLSSRVPQSKKSIMVIPYVLPILAAAGVLTIDGGRPNKVWLNL